MNEVAEAPAVEAPPVIGESQTVVDYHDRDTWLMARRRGIGASESAALFGASPWQSPYGLWAEKTGRVAAPPLDGEWLDWGRILEGPIAQRYAAVTRRQIWQVSEFAIAQHPMLPFMLATPDYWVTDAPDRLSSNGLLQVKNAASFKESDWDEGPPLHIQIQVQHEMAVTGRDWTSVGVLFGGCKFRYFDVERNAAFIAELEHKCEEFWALVQANSEPPEPDGHPATFRALARLHPLDDGSEITLGAEAADWWATFQQLTADRKRHTDAAKEIEKARDAYEAKLREAIGAATFAVIGDTRISLQHSTRKGYAVQESVSRVLREVKAKAAGARPRKGQ